MTLAKVLTGTTSAILMVVPPQISTLADSQVLGSALLASLFFVATFVIKE